MKLEFVLTSGMVYVCELTGAGALSVVVVVPPSMSWLDVAGIEIASVCVSNTNCVGEKPTSGRKYVLSPLGAAMIVIALAVAPNVNELPVNRIEEIFCPAVNVIDPVM